MNAAPVHVAGERLMLDPAGALLWPATGVLAVADLHLEKGTAAALRGQLLPPWDTRATLERLAALLRRYHPRIVVALGDSFHDREGAGRMQPSDAARLRAMAEATRFVWVLGNHDPVAPAGLAGEAVEEWRAGPLVFRHQAEPDPGQDAASGAAPRPRFAPMLPLGAVPAASASRRSDPVEGEISGHFHPKASVPTRAGTVTRPCFVAGGRRVVLPAFGAFTGGLDVRQPPIAGLFPRGGRVFLTGRERLFSFALGQVRGVDASATLSISGPA